MGQKNMHILILTQTISLYALTIPFVISYQCHLQLTCLLLKLTRYVPSWELENVLNLMLLSDFSSDSLVTYVIVRRTLSIFTKHLFC